MGLLDLLFTGWLIAEEICEYNAKKKDKYNCTLPEYYPSSKDNGSCDRCFRIGGRYNKSNCKYLINSPFTDNIGLCDDCISYLFETKNIVYRDPKGWSDTRPCNRNIKNCREFDIANNLLDDKTNLYWDEIRPDRGFPTLNKNITEESILPWQQLNINNEIVERSSDIQIGKETLIENDRIKTKKSIIKFKKNANLLISKDLHEKSTTAIYEELKRAAINSYETPFAENMQTFITRLGLIISDASYSKYTGKKHYIGVLKYICYRLIKDKDIYKNLVIINEHGNNVKHSKKNVDINVNKILKSYNQMIKRLIEISNCNALKICHIYNKKFEYKNECTICGLITPEKAYHCKNCGKIVCEECFDKEIKLCCECAKNISMM